jgi:hypothetical protein
VDHYSLLKLKSSCSFNNATFQLHVLGSPASTVLTAAAPPKGSVYGLWILHSGLHTTEFGKTISDTLFNVNCNFFGNRFHIIPNKSVVLVESVATRREQTVYLLFNDAVD